MSIQQTRETMTGYLDLLVKRGPYGQFFADDITFIVMGTDTVVKGRVEVEQFIRFFHQQAFDAEPVVKRMFFEDEHAAVEVEFVGKHIGEFMGVAASGRHVELPYMAAYDVVGTKITALRLYMAMDQLMRLIGAGEAAKHQACGDIGAKAAPAGAIPTAPAGAPRLSGEWARRARLSRVMAGQEVGQP